MKFDMIELMAPAKIILDAVKVAKQTSGKVTDLKEQKSSVTRQTADDSIVNAEDIRRVLDLKNQYYDSQIEKELSDGRERLSRMRKDAEEYVIAQTELRGEDLTADAALFLHECITDEKELERLAEKYVTNAAMRGCIRHYASEHDFSGFMLHDNCDEILDFVSAVFDALDNACSPDSYNFTRFEDTDKALAEIAQGCGIGSSWLNSKLSMKKSEIKVLTPAQREYLKNVMRTRPNDFEAEYDKL